MEWFFALKLLHVIGAAVLFGTGVGIAFFMLMAHRSGDPRVIAHVAGTVVVADTIFTATAVVAQPLTGWALAAEAGYGLESWIVASLARDVLTGGFWRPVVGVQLKLRDLARAAAVSCEVLPPRYFQLFRIWFLCGFPAFTAVVAIFALMIYRPELW